MLSRPLPRPLVPALVAALVCLAAPASAQFYGPYPYNLPPPLYGPPDDVRFGRTAPLSPNAIVDRLEDQGYDDVGRPRSNGRSYVVDATTRRGRRVSLVVDAFRGVVIDRMPIGDPRGREEADVFDDRGRREAVRPGRAFRPEAPVGPSIRGGERPRREAARPDIQPPERSAPGEPALRGTGEAFRGPGESLRGPADPRLAPSPQEAGRPLEGRIDEPAPREPVRPPAAAARVEPGGARPYGTNPGGAAPVRRKPPEQAAPARPKPAEQARVANPPAAPGAPAAVGRTPSTERPPAQVSASPQSRPRGPVRVIEGVTPINPAPAPAVAAPAAPVEPGASE